jgi:hypothetical protein
MGRVRGGLAVAALLLLVAAAAAHSHFEVLTPYEGEIFDQDDVYFEFHLHGDLAGLVVSGNHEVKRCRPCMRRVWCPR